MPEQQEAGLQVVPKQAQQLSKSPGQQVDPFEVHSIQQAIELCQRLSKSGMVPRQYVDKPDAILAAWIHGKELGVTLFQALSGISNINGTPAVFGDLGWAIVQNHPDFVDSVETVTADHAECTIKRRGRSDKTWKYTIDMARQAGLLGKDNWKNNPKRMLQWRARSWAMRDQFPDALKGLVIYEEAQDYPDTVIQGAPLVEQSKSTAPAAPDPNEQPITKEEANQLWEAKKANHKSNEEYKKALHGIAGVDSSAKVARKHFEAMMTWAKSTANPTSSAPAADTTKQQPTDAASVEQGQTDENPDAEPCEDGK